MEFTRQYPDKEYQPDYINQTKAIKLSKMKGNLIKHFLIYGIPLFIIGIIFSILKLNFLFKLTMLIYGVSFIVIFTFCMLTFPRINCSKCKRKMKKKYDVLGSQEVIFLICDDCKLYVDTGHEVGS